MTGDMTETRHISFEGVTQRNVGLLRELNTSLFPIKYQDQVYRDILACGDVTQLAMLDRKCVGGIGCRLQRIENNKDSALLYILTLGVVSPFRNQGIGSELLRRSLLVCKCDSAIVRAELHVHVTNRDAIRFYQKHGFEEHKIEKNYYKDLTPGDAVLLIKAL